MKHNPLIDLERSGQSIWLDFIKKGMLASGEFKAFIEQDGLSGVTSNPSIFETAITGSHDYDEAIRAASLEGETASEIYERLTIEDVEKAADLLGPVFENQKGRDGFASLEVSPHLANDTEGTIREARQLWKKLARPNVLIKVPATIRGIPAIQQLISEGININVTLLFGLDRYQEVIEAYLSGLETRARGRDSLRGITSVASFFLSRIDVLIDPILDKVVEAKNAQSMIASSALGQTAVASAKLAYQKYKLAFESDRFRKLKEQGAAPQRLLWASTSTKNPLESDIKYVEGLIGPETINTLPLETLNAYRDHGLPQPRIEQGLGDAAKHLSELSQLGLDLNALTGQLEVEGVSKFKAAFDRLMTALELKRKIAVSNPVNSQILNLESFGKSVKDRIASLDSEKLSQRIWQKDTSLWTSDPDKARQIAHSLGWLHIAEKMADSLGEEISLFTKEIREAGFEHVVHMGMGGSSLAPLVFARTFPCKDGIPLTILDTTDPMTIKGIEESIKAEKTLFIVASKSGMTAEPLAFKDYFFEKVKKIKGEKAGENFIAITDPNTPLIAMAQKQQFRRIFLNDSEIGGRYSALSYFGLVPASLMGVNINEILIRALESAHASASCASDSPALILGAALGELALAGHDKVTLIVDKSIATLGLWLEQLLAESTGKSGTGLIPVCDEPLGSSSCYGDDRLFVHLTVKGSVEKLERSGLNNLSKSGQPLMTIELSDLFDIGQQFFRWEFAVAAAGSVLGVDAFDQPNVQESKDNTDRLLSEIGGKIQKADQEPKPVLTEGPFTFYSTLRSTSGPDLLARFLKQAKPADYIGLMAYLPETPGSYELLQAIRLNLRDRLRLATTLGYGPRFLHSTGQLHKGGPNTGLYIQLTADNACDASIPGKPYTFGGFKAAQAQGDLEALNKHGRRAMRIHLKGDLSTGLTELLGLTNTALSSL